MFSNIPYIRLGIVAVSRDCFPISLSQKRLEAVCKEYSDQFDAVYAAKTIVENEQHAMEALKELQTANVNALVIYLGNFGPEGPETLLAQKFDGPVMFIAAAEERGDSLIEGRGDAYCGMLNASYSLGLRGVKAYIPEKPFGLAHEAAQMIHQFVPIARTFIGIKSLKIITFGPRPQDFLACNAPIKPLYDLGIVSIQENSELDLLSAFRRHENDPRIADIISDMQQDIGESPMAGVIPKMAQYELTLLDWVEENKGAAKYITMANKCWPAFAGEFGFVPCYVNSRFTGNLMPIACEVDIYGALSEYMIACAMQDAPTLLDINNTVPRDLYEQEIKGKFNYGLDDLFMGFHCGNTPKKHVVQGELKHQLIMKRFLEPDSEPNVTRGTLEGNLVPGDATFFRLHASADCQLRAYIAQGEILPVGAKSFGSIGIFAIPEMTRFYRHVLIEKQYPHHGAVAFEKAGKILFEALKLLGVCEIDYNQDKAKLYPRENPFM